MSLLCVPQRVDVVADAAAAGRGRHHPVPVPVRVAGAPATRARRRPALHCTNVMYMPRTTTLISHSINNLASLLNGAVQP